jgi:hypothetical protein
VTISLQVGRVVEPIASPARLLESNPGSGSV